MSFCNCNSKSDGRRYHFFSFNYSSSLTTSESRARTPLPDSFECFFDPQRSFGNHLRTFRQYLASPVLEKSRFFLLQRNFSPSYAGTPYLEILVSKPFLGCLLGFWPRRPKPCRSKNFALSIRGLSLLPLKSPNKIVINVTVSTKNIMFSKPRNKSLPKGFRASTVRVNSGI